jgi:hypothetical protein
VLSRAPNKQRIMRTEMNDAGSKKVVQRWQTHGVIAHPPSRHVWIASHAQTPTPLKMENGQVRIYFGARDAQNRTMAVFLDVCANEPERALPLHDTPLLELGRPGAFDDCGIMPSSAVIWQSSVFLYYTGWNTAVTVPYRNAIGVAVSDDGGETFSRPFDGPVLDRNKADPYFVATPFVADDGGILRMWYLSATSWQIIDGRMEPSYTIRHAESADGFDWKPFGAECVACGDDEALARPWVLRGKRLYHMWYCYRSLHGYRNDPRRSYRIGYATSRDGLVFERRDAEVEMGDGRDTWDSEMQAYPALYAEGGRYYLLYNGNGFGKGGFGYATSELVLE